MLFSFVLLFGQKKNLIHTLFMDPNPWPIPFYPSSLPKSDLGNPFPLPPSSRNPSHSSLTTYQVRKSCSPTTKINFPSSFPFSVVYEWFRVISSPSFQSCVTILRQKRKFVTSFHFCHTWMSLRGVFKEEGLAWKFRGIDKWIKGDLDDTLKRDGITWKFGSHFSTDKQLSLTVKITTIGINYYLDTTS